MIEKTFLKIKGKKMARVTFSLPQTIWAAAIYLVGDFNNWNRTSHPLRQDSAGRWTITVDLAPGHAYQFRYLVDDEWMNDNQADAYATNQYGTHNFIVVTDSNYVKYAG